MSVCYNNWLVVLQLILVSHSGSGIQFHVNPIVKKYYTKDLGATIEEFIGLVEGNKSYVITAVVPITVKMFEANFKGY